MYLRATSSILVLLIAVTFLGCDSDPGVSRLEVDGVYTVQTWTFDPDASFLVTEDVKLRIDTTYTQMSFASGSAEYALNFRFNGGSQETYIISGGYDTEGDNRVVVDFEDDRDRLRLLLPNRISFSYDEIEGVLSFNSRIAANLEEFDPAKYRGTGVPLTTVNGRLNIVLTRR